MLYSLKRIYKKIPPENQVEKPGFFDIRKNIHFVAKKKIFKSSVDRNKVKRRAKHAFFEAIKLSPPLPQTLEKIMFFLEHDMMQENFSTIVESFKKDLSK